METAMAGITGPSTVVGTLQSGHRPAATITADGVWHCPGDLHWAAVLNGLYGPDSRPDGPSVLPHALRALRTAERDLDGKATLEIDWQPLPPGVVS
jgi:hypothetical protein